MLLHPVFQKSLSPLKSLVHVSPISIVTCCHPLLGLYFLYSNTLACAHFLLNHLLHERIIAYLFGRNKVSTLKTSVPSAVSLLAISYHGNIKVTACFIMLYTTLYKLVYLRVHYACHSFRKCHLLTIERSETPH